MRFGKDHRTTLFRHRCGFSGIRGALGQTARVVWCCRGALASARASAGTNYLLLFGPNLKLSRVRGNEKVVSRFHHHIKKGGGGSGDTQKVNDRTIGCTLVLHPSERRVRLYHGCGVVEGIYTAQRNTHTFKIMNETTALTLHTSLQIYINTR